MSGNVSGGRREAVRTVGTEASGLRVDRFIAEELGLFPRSQFRNHALTITINGEDAKPSRTVKPGDEVRISFEEPPPPEVAAEDIPLDILYEDDNVVVLNKQAGMVVHPGAGNRAGTVVNALLHHVGELGPFPPTVRPGIVHRLDKDTSGVLITAKNEAAHEFLARQFRDRSLEKTYLAVIRGVPPRSSGTVSSPLARDPRNRKRFTTVAGRGKPAETEYRVMRRFHGYALLSVHPLTGRTHQIRVHLRSIQCPIVGDPIYGRRDRLFPEVGLMLHAYRLTIVLPGDAEPRAFVAPLPDGFRTALRALSDLPSGRPGVPQLR